MTDSPSYATVRIEPNDAKAGFRSGVRALDDYFARHAVSNDREGIGAAYVLRRPDDDDTSLPQVLGFYTLSMALLEGADAAKVLAKKLPKYPMPVALIGRLAVDERARGRRLGEMLLIDALHRVVDAAGIIGCIGVIVDAKDEGAERFYTKYDFVTVHGDEWPRRMFLPVGTAKAAFAAID
jgi:GNAT superfamily N-acetyltransferase